MKLTKDQARHFLRSVPDPLCFYAHHHQRFANLPELVAGLRAMPESVFQHHSTQEKSDLSAWVRDVIGDGALADELWSVRAGSLGKAVQVAEDRLDDIARAAGVPARERRRSILGIL